MGSSLPIILAAGDPGYTPIHNGPEVRVEIAFNAGYLTPAVDRVWTDVSEYVDLDRSAVSVERGRGDQHSAVQPSRFSLTLDNKDGRFTPENTGSPYYPNVKRGRPVRISATTVTGVASILVVGYADTWPIAWPGGSDAYSSVMVSGSSRMARLGKTAEFRSIVEEEVLYDDPMFEFPLGEPAGATEAGNIAPGRSERLVVTQLGSGGTLEFGAGIGPGTDDLTAPIFTRSNATNGKYLAATLVEPLPSGTHVVELEISFITTITSSASVVLAGMPIYSTNPVAGDYYLMGLYLAATGQVVGDGGGHNDSVAISAGAVNDGLLHHAVLRVTLTDPSTVVAALILDGTLVSTSGSNTWPFSSGGVAYFPASLSQLHVGGTSPGRFNYTNTQALELYSGTIAHVGLHAHAATPLSNARFTEHYNAGANGFTADASGARVARYARLAGIPTAEISTETGLSTSIAHADTTGQSPVEMMQKVATTEDGLVFDGRDGTLTFHSRSHRYGATSAFTLSCTAGEVEADLSPVLDDQGMTNDMTASRKDGATIRSVNQASIDEHGYYRETVELMTTSDNEVQSRADWQVNRFGTPRVKLTSITVDLINSSSSQITALLAADIGTRFTVSNLPSQAPASSMQFFIEGVDYQIGPEFFTVTFNTSAAAYADVFIWDTSEWDETTTWAY